MLRFAVEALLSARWRRSKGDLMADTSATWSDVGSPPSLAAMSVGDTKTVSGAFSSVSRLRRLIRKTYGGYTTARAFKLTMAATDSGGPHVVVVTRTV